MAQQVRLQLWDREYTGSNTPRYMTGSPISANATRKLESPKTDRELDNTIKDTKLGKAPGPDGFPLHYYKTFSNILKP